MDFTLIMFTQTTNMTNLTQQPGVKMDDRGPDPLNESVQT